MVVLIIVLFLVTFTTLGIGGIMGKWLQLTAWDEKQILLGLIASNCICTLLSLCFPTNYVTGLVLMSLASWGWSKGYVRIPIIPWNSLPWKYQLNLCVALCLLFLLSLAIPQNFDTHLYHLQSIRWNTQYAVVPGLGNLHSRLGFNAQLFSVYPAFTFSELWGREILWVNPFLTGVISTTFFLRGIQAFRNRKQMVKALGYGCLLMLTVILSPDLSSASPDLPVNLLMVYILTTGAEVYFQSQQKGRGIGIFLLGISLWAVTCKLSAWALPLFASLGLIFMGLNRKNILRVGIISIVVLLPWMIKNYIISGYIIYPVLYFNQLSAWVDWSVPESVGLQESLGVVGWARHSGAGYKWAATAEHLQWFPYWWNSISLGVKIFLMIGIILPPVWIGVHSVKKNLQRWNLYYLGIWMVMLVWLYYLPSLRLGIGWLILCVFFPFFYPVAVKQPGAWLKNWGLILFWLWPMALGINRFQSLKGVTVQMIHQDRWWLPAWQPTPKELKTTSIKLKAGKIMLPLNDQRCFDLPIPCTPKLSSEIELRGNTFQEGFRIRKANR